MVNPNPSFLSKRVKKRDPSGITSDRYEFLGLDQAEPDLGDPIVGPSSVGVNPLPPSVDDPYVLVTDGSGTGKRYWTQKANLIAGGVLIPGSISVQNNGVRVGSVNIIKDINFVGSGVTVDPIAIGATVGVATVRITVTDVFAAGQLSEIQYHGANGLLQGSTGFVYNASNQRVGIGSTTPREKLDVVGNLLVSGIASVGVLTTREGYFTSKLVVGNFEISDNTTFVRVSAGKVGIGTTNPTATLDVIGDVKISGIATIGRINNTQITSQHINNSGIITSNAYNIGLTPVIDSSRQLRNILSLDAVTKNTIENSIALSPNDFTDINVTGLGTINSLQVTTQTTLVNENVTGISTINNLNVTGVATVSTLRVTNSFAGFSSATNSRVTGVSTVGILSATKVIASTIESSFVGIGTSLPTKPLDVIGDIGLTGAIYAINGSGTSGQVLISNGISPVTWGSPSEVTAGSATSLSVFGVSDNRTYFPVFARTVGTISTISANVNGLSYNPAFNSLGIGTTGTGFNLNVQGTSNLNGNVSVGGTLTELFNGTYWNVVTQADVGYGASQVPLNQYLGQLAFMDEYLPPQFNNTDVVTTSTATVTLDSIPAIQIRSAKYNVQVTCNGQLVGSGTSSSSASVTNLIGGTKYVHGNYTNIALVTNQGSGVDARANINVNREFQLAIDSIIDGVFNTETSTAGVTTGTPVVFNRTIPTSAAENSRVTSITITNTGTGYTTIPTLTIANPTNNPAIPGVTDIGSTATAVVTSMVLNRINVFSGVSTTVGVGTSGIPTLTFNSPIGAGATAIGRVGFGVSNIIISNPGFGITSLPTISFSGTRITSPSAGITSVFVTNLYATNTGYGYSIGNYPTISFTPPTSGTSAAATVTSLSISDYYAINSPGAGYTVAPVLTVSSPSVGVNTAIVGATLGIVTFTVTNPGFGYTLSPLLSISPNPINFSGRVGMGITLTNSQFSGGSNYSNTPVFNVIPVGGIGTGAQIGLVSKDADTGAITQIELVNPGFGYTAPPTINITDSTGVGAALTITELFFSDIQVLNIGYGLTQTPSVTLIAQQALGSGAAASPVLGIGSVFTVGFGSGYNNTPSIAVTAFDGVTGAGASVVSLGLGVTSGFIEITNPGTGYTFIPSSQVNSLVSVAESTRTLTGVGATRITAFTTGIGFSDSVPTVGFDYDSPPPFTNRVAASVTSIRITNGYIDTVGVGYTAFDLASSGIATFSVPGVGATVGFGVSTVELVNLGIGYTLAPTVTFSSPNIGLTTAGFTTVGLNTATAFSSLGYPGILPGVAFTTGTNQIYYVAEVPTSNALRLSIGVGFGTLSRTDVSDNAFISDKPNAFVGGSISNVAVVSPGSGYTSRSIVSATNFDGANVGSGFTFIASPVDNFQISDVMLLQSVGSARTSCDFIEYATLANNEILGSFGSDISGDGNNAAGNLRFTPTYRNNTIKISRNKIDI
jgi:hypothetical protein